MARAFTAAMLAEIQKQTVSPVIFYQGDFDGGSIYLWSGVGTIVWNGITWNGAGQLLSVSAIDETVQVVAAGVQIGLSGLPSSLVSLALSSARQGKKGKVWLGFIGRVSQDNGTAQAGAASALTLRAAASAVNGAYNGKILHLNDGSAREKRIGDYNGATKVATVEAVWPVNSLTKSSAVDHANWTKQNGITITANYGIAPDGTLKAERAQTDGLSLARYFQTFTGYAGKNACFALKMRSNNAANQSIQIHLRETGFGTTYVNAFVTVTPAWQLFSVAAAIPGGSAGVMALFYDSAGTNVWDVLVCEHQVNEGLAPIEFIETDASAFALPGNTTTYDVFDDNAVIADPYQIFTGLLDVPMMDETGDTSNLTISYENRLVGLLTANDRRYTPEDQHVEFAGDTGFDSVAGLQDAQIVW